MSQRSKSGRMTAIGLAVVAAVALAAPASIAGNKNGPGCSVTVSGSHTSYGTLQAAVKAASSGDTLTVSGTCYGSTSISSMDLTIAGRHGATLDGGKAGSVLWIYDSKVTVRNLAITNGYNATGGGVYNMGTLALKGTTVEGNAAAYNGGGIYNSGTLDLGHSKINGNSAGARGGGIYNMGTLKVGGGSSVTGNQPQDIYPTP